MTVMNADTIESSPARATLVAFQREIQLRAPQLACHIAPHIDGPQLRLAQDGRIWLLAPAAQDPQLAGARPVLPHSAVTDLRRIAASGIDFHAIVIGHEIEMTGPARALAPQLQDGPRSCPPELARTLVGPVPPYPPAARLAQRMGAVAAVLARSAARLPSLAGTLDLDPVVFGLISADGQLKAGRPVLWVACTKWDW